ncbi:MAG TPA: hypothetical protein VF411_00925 [Bacteroidia bacterium]
MKTSKNLILMIAIVAIVSCKKDTDLTIKPSGSNVVQSYSEPSYATIYSGSFRFEKIIFYTKNPYQYSTTNSVWAYFSNTPCAYSDSASFIKVDSVSLNNYNIPFIDATQNFYSLGIYSNAIYEPTTWKIKSHNGIIPSFNYTNPDSLPRYSGYSLLPDTIFLNKPFTINFVGLYNMDSLSLDVTIGSGVGTGQGTIVAKNSYSASVTFPQSQVAFLSPSLNGTILVTVQKIRKRKILGKNYYFEIISTFIKNSVVVI